jgi:4-hydroxy-tetrahydrodipicolinate synthase
MPKFQAELVPAMLTPFKKDQSVDFEKAEQLAVYLAENGCDGILINGTTGESPTLTWDEKIELVKAVKSAVRDKQVQIMVGVGGNDTHKSVEEVRKMAALDPDALLCVVPYYNKPSQRGMMAHFRELAHVTDTEIVIYNIPSRCVVQMSADTMAALHRECPNIIGVKQSHPDMDAVSEISAKLPQDSWLTWCGDDSLTLPMMACGAHGVVSVLAHMTGPMLREMIRAVKRNELAQARRLHLKLLNMSREIFFLPNPTVIKTCMARLGFMEPTMRPPMVEPSDEEMARIDKILAEYKSLTLQQVG